jgi:DNA-binding response OmpR family regulator
MTPFRIGTETTIPSDNLNDCPILYIFQNAPESDCQHWGSAAMMSTERPVVPFPSMVPSERPIVYEVLLVDDDDAVRAMMTATLEHKGFGVLAVANVTDALKLITTETFDVLTTNLHMPNPGDGFAVATAMRHPQPNALTLLVSGYTDVQSAMAAILLEEDEIMVIPFEAGRLADLVHEKMLTREPVVQPEKQRVAAMLDRCIASVIADWLARAKESSELNHLSLSADERTGHLPKLVRDLVVRLSKPSATTKDSDAAFSEPAIANGKLRYQLGYAPARLVHESRIFQVTLFGTLHSNLNLLDFRLLLPDVMTIADEVDAQLTQTMDS